ncbi:four-carbon acid sugar kinase family protein [Xanthobacteraceae bacterium Astr-EGSB]|uniref:four-carbon acid sugar kinase family protein n=1 Tax=Astrobacterium formosum TaxID=3069710 RepID=UPI0027B0E5FB|nr:four-carbon acid sugar kinase family protein [Xanthobacteraceae bacterium Astr-EGSB]
MDRVAILADDFTGACDTGVHFACTGMRTAFVLDPGAIASAFDSYNALALTTETRFLAPKDAAGKVFESVSLCRQAGVNFFFKKTDSALRGNPGAETEAVLNALKFPAALICSALPAFGRTVADGILLINGTPVHETSLGNDDATSMTTSDVAEWMTRQTRMRAGHVGIADLERGRDHLVRKVRTLTESGCAAIVSDAVTNEHLDALSGVLMASRDPHGDLPPLLPVGSAGLGKAMAKAFSGTVIRKAIRPHGRMLAVVGGMNETDLEQMDFAVRNDRCALLSFSVERALHDPEGVCEALLRVASKTDKHVVLHGDSSEESTMAIESGDHVANVYGRLVLGLCRALPFTTVFVTGGHTAISAVEHLGISSMMLEEEPLPGVALGSCYSDATNVRWFLSKAGGFGDRETLLSIADTLVR